MPQIAAIAAAGMAMGGGIAAGQANRDAATQSGGAQKAALNDYIAKLDSVGMPPDQSAKLILDQYRQAGILTPDLMNQVQQQVSAFNQVKANPDLVNTQMQALQRMSQLGQAGLTADERSQQRLLQQQAQQANNANQQSIIQNMAARGIQGGGAEIAARLGASQNAANTGSSAADQVSSMAQQRALQAIAQSGGMAGQMNQQQFGQQATVAGAQDQMNRFNTQNQMAINQYNTQASNQAQAANLANSQQISNANVGQTNQEQYAALQRQMQDWYAKLNYAQAYQNPLTNYGNAGAQQANSGQKALGAEWQGALGGAAQGLMSAFGGAGGAAAGAIGGAGGGSGGAGGGSGGAGPTQANFNNMSSGSGMTGTPYYGTTQYGSGMVNQ